jgi:spore coat polysaccharide biosynthesis protein SpsF (cytidylyltransferase family)
MRVGAVIEARMTSSRLPGKHLLNLGSKKSIELLIGRLKTNKMIEEIILAAPDSKESECLRLIAESSNIGFFAGSEHDVMERVLNTLDYFSIDIAIEVTGDCPLVEMVLMHEMLTYFLNSNLDYVSNGNSGLADGLGSQIFTREALRRAYIDVTDKYDKEHVTTYFKKNPNLFKVENLKVDLEYTHIKHKLSLDTFEDYKLLNFIVKKIERKKDSVLLDYSDIKSVLNLEDSL